MNILGISAFYHDSAACLLRDGTIVAAAQEERFSRIKHDYRFPEQAIAYCLQEAGIGPADIDHVAFYDKPLLKFDRLLETYISYAPLGFRSFLHALPLWLKQKLHLPREIRAGLEAAQGHMDRGLFGSHFDMRTAGVPAADVPGGGTPAGGGAGAYTGRIAFVEHHESHAASAFFPSPFQEAAILTLDGVGEWATASWGVGKGNAMQLSNELRFPHSLGLLYSAFTYFCGFRVNSGEYKLMGLAPYGEPKYAKLIRDNLIDIKDDGSFRLAMEYFTYPHTLRMTGRRMEELLGGARREPESPLSQREMDLAASIQVITEEIMLKTARHLRRETGMRKLVMAGGVALNCVGNGKILREEIFDDIWIQPAAGDAGGALGAALFLWHQLLEQTRHADERHDVQHASLLGPGFSNQQIQNYLDNIGANYEFFEDENALLDTVSDAMVGGKVVGNFHGRMEFGPRALGNRSIIGDARSTEMQSVMNLKIKFRESFRPFAPCVLREHVSEWFEMEDEQDSPYMLLVAPVRQDKHVDAPGKVTAGADGAVARLLSNQRSEVPAITHVDHSARVQTVDEARHGRYYRLIKRFFEKTGCPVIINTSFNVRGEPIVCTPHDAFHCFMGTDMDVLVLENCVLYKKDQPESMLSNREDYLSQFELD